MAEKRYYWLKLQDDFFNSLRIKKLRKLAGGDTFTIIYLKMQLLAMKKDGVLEYKGLEDSFAEELALELDEDEDNVEITVRYLLSCGLMETSDNKEFFVPYAVLNTGSEGSSTKRVREHRERRALQCNAAVTPMEQNCNGEKEIEIEKETDIEKEESMEPPAASPAPAPEPPKPVRHKYGEYRWVRLTDAEHGKLLKDLGAAELQRCINYVDESAQRSGNKNKWKDWNLVIRKCSREGWGLNSRYRAASNTGFETSNPFLEMMQEENRKP